MRISDWSSDVCSSDLWSAAMIHSPSTNGDGAEASARDPESRWFGYKPVDPAEKTSLVSAVFAGVAGRYALMNDLLSGGVHRLWKNRFMGPVRTRPGDGLLEVAGGPGDRTLRFPGPARPGGGAPTVPPPRKTVRA